MSQPVLGQVPFLPEGFAFPPLPYLLVLVAAIAAVGIGLVRRRPAVTAAHILAFGPWIAVGAAGHVLFVLEALPMAIEPLGGTPAVYLTTGAIAAAAWLAIDQIGPPERVPLALAALGGIVALALSAVIVSAGAARGTLAVAWPLVGVLVSIPLTAIAWTILDRQRPEAAAVTGSVGLFVLFGHALDAVTTTVGVDILGFGERTPLSQAILSIAESLPTAAILGTGWLFVLVKLVLAGVIVVLFAEYVETEPTEGRLLLGFIAAVGLGPGIHNVLLFVATGGA